MSIHRVELKVTFYADAVTADDVEEDVRTQRFDWSNELRHADVNVTEVTEVAQIDKDWKECLPYSRYQNPANLTCEQMFHAGRVLK